MRKQLVPVNPEYSFCDTLSQPAVVSLTKTLPDSDTLRALRDAVTDRQCGLRERQCYMRPSAEPGCGVRITTEDGALLAECPTGTMEPYVDCAQHVLEAIVRQL